MMNRRPFYQNYGASSAPNVNGGDQQPGQFQNRPPGNPYHWQPAMNNMNNQQFHLNPQASPYQSTAYPPTASYFNLTSISKNKTENHNNISKPLQKLSSEGVARPSHPLSSSESSLNSSSKKHKREHSLAELNKFLNEAKEDIHHYERKRKRLLEDMQRLKEELKSCEDHLNNHRQKYKNIMADIGKKQKEQQRENKRSSEDRSSSGSGVSRSNHNTPPSNSMSNGPSSSATNNHSPVGASANSINNLTISSNSPGSSANGPTNGKAPANGPVNAQTNAQSTINNVINSLLVKKRDVEFESYDFIFTVVEEIYEPKLVTVVGSKIDINLSFNKLLTSEDKKAGYRYIVRGCIYDSSSIKQFDNLSFVKSYEFVSTSKKYTYENHDTSANKLIFPFDLTDYCRFDKKLTVTVNLNKKLVDGKKIAVGVYFVKKLDFAKTIEQVHNLEKIRRKKSDITKNQVTNAFNSITGIEMDSIKVSLIDPLTKAKIKMPCIGESCEHIGTFDALTFLESNSKKFSWLITEILKKISMDCVAIAFDKLSNWMPLSELSERKETVQPTMEEDDDDCIALE